MNDTRTYVCRRQRVCSYLMDSGFTPYRITPDRYNRRYDVYLFTQTPELMKAVIEYGKQSKEDNKRKD
jgi:hypothetical protein